MPRATGRSFIVNFLGEEGKALDKNNYNVEPDVVISYQPAIKEGVVSKDFVEELVSENENAIWF